ncbi:nitroreductase family protein [Pseudomonas sp. 5P_3.1_Bac2]|uniref:nitroreductase family protein n=1 Tax=Pseudomonas sp. 5P_3.1_Bac2 TaxID=2971617 RepID=UPI0021C864D9|nr:nitroreductase family protein [Pseudomonas sp. 5P_3.1_Bac2]MCU1718527.1 nitroreductase family protein [Pseudomonas sp. 5P_3.1_Bac2]
MLIDEVIRSRRAVRAFDPSFSLSAAEQQELLELSLFAPSAFNLQHVRLVQVSDPQLREQIRAIAWDQAQVTDSALLVVVCARVDSWSSHAERVWQEAPQPVREFMHGAIQGYYQDQPQVQRDECMRSCGLAAQTLMLAARGKGLDSCPMDGFDFAAMAKLINLPEDHLIALMVAVGKKAGADHPRIGQLPFAERVRQNGF